jgi:hypothetical protein
MKYINILIKNILKLNRQYIFIVSIFIFIILIPDTANANDWLTWFADQTLGRAAANMFGALKNIFIEILKLAVMPLVTNVMSYQNFFSNGVNTGWTITRDFANLFFALILLIIAIATVLNVGALSNYTAKRMLPTFIFVALFINFSKAIVGFLIDISQIIMISLYNSFGPNLANTITQASKFAEASADSQTNVLVLNVFIIVLLLVLIGTLLWTALILAMRIVTLWFVIMLSPLAFVSYLVPGLNSINNDWRNKLQEALITGPTLMFLLYLAMTLMNAGLSTNLNNSGNLIQNGNLINYVLVIGLLFLANSTATKAGQAAPQMLQKAVGIATTAATFGLGAYVGAGGYGTGTMIKTGIKGGDKIAGGITNVAGAVGGVTGIKALQNANQKYESKKRDLIEQQKEGVGFVGRFQGFSAEGKKSQLEDFEKKKALRLYNQNQLDEKGNERYKKIAATLQATAATEVKDEYNVTKLGEQMKSALKEGDKFTAMAIATRISELKGWNKIFTEGEYSRYSDPSNGYDTDAKQLDAFMNDNFEIKDSSGAVIDSNKTMNSFRSRQANILNDKGAGNFAAGLAERKVSDPNLSPSAKAAKAGLVGAGDMVAKNNSIFNSKSKVTDSSGREIYEDYFDISKFAPIIANESSLDNLEDPKSWNKYGGIRANIIKEINNYLSLYQSDPALASTTYPALSVPEIGEKKLRAALKGLGDKNRITSSP